MRELGASRWRWIALGAVELALFACAVLPFLLHNELTEHDLIGHRAAAAWSAEVLWPSPRGWDPRFFCGAPFGIAYPPALSWLVGGVARLIGLSPALKLWVALGVLATPLSIYAAASALVSTAEAALAASFAATLYLAARTAELGGNFSATFQTGNLAEALALPLFFLYVAALPALLRGRPMRAALLLAAVLLTHLVTGLVALVLLVAVFLVAPPGAARRAVSLHALSAFLLSAFFTLPLVLERGHGAQPLISYDQYPDLAIEGLLSMACLGIGVFVLVKDGLSTVERRVTAAILGAAALVYVLRAFVFSEPPAGGWHLHRFKLFDQLLVLTLGAALVTERLAVHIEGPRGRRLAICTGVILIGLVAVSSARLPTRGVGPQPFPTDALRAELAQRPGRVMVVVGPTRQASDHVVQHLAALAGARVAKGLFIESAVHGPLLVELERLLSTGVVRAWGIVLAGATELRRLEPRRDELLLHLGYSTVLSNDPLRSPPGPARRLGEGFLLTALPEQEGRGALAVPWRDSLEAVHPDPERYRAARGRFLEHGAPLPFRDPEALALLGPRTPAPADAEVRAQETADGQGIELEISAGSAHGPIPVLVRTSYHPGWQAEDGRGAKLPVYEAAPHLMLLFAEGPVHLHFGYSRVERAAAIISAGGLASLLIVIAITGLLRRRRTM